MDQCFMCSGRKGYRFQFLSGPAYLVTSISCPVENIKCLSFRGGMVPQ